MSGEYRIVVCCGVKTLKRFKAAKILHFCICNGIWETIEDQIQKEHAKVRN